MKYFDALKMGIEEILEEKVIEQKRQERRKTTKQSLDVVRGLISKKSDKV